MVRRFSRLGLGGCLGLAFLAIAAPVNAGNTPQTGSAGGRPFEAACHAGDLLTGLHYAAGRDVDWFVPICSVFRTGIMTDEDYDLDHFGGAGTTGSQSGTLRCPPQTAVIALSAFVDNQGQIRRLGLACGPVIRTLAEPVSISSVNPPGHGGVDQSSRELDCDGQIGSMALGVTGAFTSSVNRLGLMCTKFIKYDPPDRKEADGIVPPPVDDGPDATGDVPVEDAAGGTRTANEATTIYAAEDGNEIGYLEQGDTVTIVNCEDGGEGWCTISDPRQGYVWGGDFEP